MANFGSPPAEPGVYLGEMTLYSSTADALQLYAQGMTCFYHVPSACSVPSWVAGGDQCDYIGERLAIHEFNAKYAMRKLSQMYGLRHFVPPVNN